MFASIRQYQTQSPNEFIRRLNREFVPLITQTEGMVAYYAVHAANDIVVSVSVFQTEAEAAESNRCAANWVAHITTPVAACWQEIMDWH
ncbi:MAG: hypothetical protein ACM359_22680 [Bacillota bacterium]